MCVKSLSLVLLGMVALVSGISLADEASEIQDLAPTSELVIQEGERLPALVDRSCIGKPDGTYCTSDTGIGGTCSGGSCFAQ